MSFKNLMNFRAMNFMVFCINCSFDVIDCCLFPQIGLTKSATASEQLQICIVQGNIAKWHKKEGDAVSAGDVLCEIETVSSCALSCYWYVQAWKCSSWPLSFLVPSMFRFWDYHCMWESMPRQIFLKMSPKRTCFRLATGFFFRFCEINNRPSFPEISKINQIYTRKIKFPNFFVEKTTFAPKKFTGWQHALYRGVGQFYGLE